MSIVCSKCGKTDVRCEAMVNPNTREIDNYTDESFEYGWCNDCNFGFPLVDIEETQKEIDKMYEEFVKETGTEPRYANCTITDFYAGEDSNDYDLLEVVIKLSCDSSEDDDHVFLFWNGIENIRDCVVPGGSLTILSCNSLS